MSAPEHAPKQAAWRVHVVVKVYVAAVLACAAHAFVDDSFVYLAFLTAPGGLLSLLGLWSTMHGASIGPYVAFNVLCGIGNALALNGLFAAMRRRPSV